MTQSSSSGSKFFAMTYHYVPDMVERRGPLRDAHRARLQRANADGLLLVGGGYDNPADGALLIMRANDVSEIYAWAAQDPYHGAGLITGVTVRQINLAFGAPPA